MRIFLGNGSLILRSSIYNMGAPQFVPESEQIFSEVEKNFVRIYSTAIRSIKKYRNFEFYMDGNRQKAFHS